MSNIRVLRCLVPGMVTPGATVASPVAHPMKRSALLAAARNARDSMWAKASCRLLPMRVWMPHRSMTQATTMSPHCHKTGRPRPRAKWQGTWARIHSASAAVAPSHPPFPVHGRRNSAAAARLSVVSSSFTLPVPLPSGASMSLSPATTH